MKRKINKWTCECGEVYTSDTTSQIEANCLECGKKIIRDDRKKPKISEDTQKFINKLEKQGYKILIKSDNELVVKEPDGTTKILTKNIPTD